MNLWLPLVLLLTFSLGFLKDFTLFSSMWVSKEDILSLVILLTILQLLELLPRLRIRGLCGIGLSINKWIYYITDNTFIWITICIVIFVSVGDTITRVYSLPMSTVPLLFWFLFMSGREFILINILFLTASKWRLSCRVITFYKRILISNKIW